MPTDDPDDDAATPSLIDAAKERAAKEAGRAAALSAMAAVETVAHSALDAAERFFFGKVGGAEEALARDAGVDPLDRVRAAYGVEKAAPPAEAAPPPPARPDPVAVAREQLAELKRKRAATNEAPVEPAERKKTL